MTLLGEPAVAHFFTPQALNTVAQGKKDEPKRVFSPPWVRIRINFYRPSRVRRIPSGVTEDESVAWELRPR